MHIEVDAEGIDEIRVDCVAAEFELAFGGVERATLDARGKHAEDWELHREGDSLIASPKEREKTAVNYKGPQVVLTLPESLNDGSVLLHAEVAASEFRAKGSFIALEVQLAASKADIHAQTEQAKIELAAGSVRAKLLGVAQASLEVAAGEMLAWFQESAPSKLDISIAAGSAEVLLPDVPYQLSKSAVLGKFRSTLQHTAASPNVVNAEVAAGKLTLTRSADPGPGLGPF